jgi:hypothetical protein
LHTALEKQSHKRKPERIKQIAYYHDGVGTDENKVMKIIGGAFGFGLNRIIIELYIFLVNNYEPGDKVYLFGFSRGSYTIRLLAGVITSFGIIKKDNYIEKSDQDLREDVTALLKKYKELQKTKKSGPQGKITSNIYSTHENSHTIEFIGVWDTVDAYGIPSDLLAKVFDKLFNTSFRYHDRTLSSDVLMARHALALDEKRRVFSPVLWDEASLEDHENIQQVWFCGTHSNVGGGYPKQGLAWTSLEWMLEEAKKAGLFFDHGDLRQFRENKDVHDRLYDSRAGFAAYYAYKVRDVWNLVNDVSAVQDDKIGPRKIMPRIHVSVFDRIMQRTQEYSPNNIPESFEIIGADEEDKAVHSFANLYKNRAGKNYNKDTDELETGTLAFTRRYSSYMVFWTQAFIALFFIHLCRSNFSWNSLTATIAAIVSIWFVIWRCVRFVQNREKRHYSKLWRGLISRHQKGESKTFDPAD